MKDSYHLNEEVQVIRDREHLKNLNQYKKEVKNKLKVDQEVQSQNKKKNQKESNLIHQILLIKQIKQIIKENLQKNLQNLRKILLIEDQVQKKEKLSNLIGMDIILME